jgi:hypothetical protein
MKFIFKSLLKEKSVLYITLFFTITNLFGYLMKNNFKAIILFLIAGIISSYFSKNMIIIMFGSLLITNLFVVMTGYFGNTSNKNKEGFEGDDKEDDKKDKDDKEADKKDKDNKNNKEEEKVNTNGDAKNTTAVEKNNEAPSISTTSTSTPKPNTEPPSSSSKPITDDVVGVSSEKPSINFASTLEKAYGNLESFLSPEAINKMSTDTQQLAKQQESLMVNIDKLAPIMKTAENLLDKLNFDKMGNMGDMLNSMKDKLTKSGQ